MLLRNVDILFVALNFVFAVLSHRQSQPKIQRNLPTNPLDTYDYVVVGSGPGGGPLAARLAIAGKTVLLIDAGDDQGESVPYKVPALSLQATEFGPMKWEYYVNHFSNLNTQKRDTKMTYLTANNDTYVGQNPPTGSTPLGILYPRAGILGGCSGHNALITAYPHRSDWDSIAAITGDSSWGSTHMRKYFQRLEKCMYLPDGTAGHGSKGWLATSLTNLNLIVQDSKLLKITVDAIIAMGYRGFGTKSITSVRDLSRILLKDLNSVAYSRDETQGVYQLPMAVGNGSRSGARDIILATANAKNPDGSRKFHLDILLDTLATKVLFDLNGYRPRATGVQFLRGKSLYRADPRSATARDGTLGVVKAAKEVIVAAGAFNTPQLLKLSGIGPREELTSFNIPVVVDLPGVGTNLQDRYETTVVGKAGSDFEVSEGCTYLHTNDDSCLAKWQNGSNSSSKGLYASNGIFIGIVKKSSVAAPTDDPDLFIIGAPFAFKGYYPGYSGDATSDGRHWTWLVLKAHTRNRAGNVKLRSKDPRDTPLIDFKNFNDRANGSLDAKALVEGMKFARKMLHSVADFTEVLPGALASTDVDLDSWVRKESWGHHASCTCPIGRENDPLAVLDSKFRVRGVERLRVVDASVFPRIPGYFIAVPVYMVSEKAADVILGIQ